MKKVALAIIILSGIAFTSCKKEVAEPKLVIKRTVSDVRDAGTWDGITDNTGNK